MKKIYLDNNATTPVHPEVVKAMLPYYRKYYGNASSLHSFGRDARGAMEKAREKIAGLIGANPEEVVFTSGGTEADNFALNGVTGAGEKGGNHIITSAIEHHAVLNCCQYLEKRGFDVTYLPVDKYGLIDPVQVKEAITNKTVIISIMLANNEVGTIEPIAEIGEIAREMGIYLHTDAIQAVGKIPVNVNDLKVDLLSISGHKINGPKGIGALYIKRGIRMVSFLHGGHHEKNRRAGTENIPAIVGLGKAAEFAAGGMEKKNKNLTELRDRLHKGITDKIDQVYLNGHPTLRLPNTLNLSFAYVEGESLLLNLDLKGIAVSTGSACTSGSPEPSHVLVAMGIEPVLAQGSLRFSLGPENTKEEIDTTVECLAETVKRLRMLSPLYSEKAKNEPKRKGRKNARL
jgi:cysteine desulfurase